jgi:DNA-binding NtrC family response regulator
MEMLLELPEEGGHEHDDPTRRSLAAREFAARIEVASQTRVPVFLLGPSGCGKTHTARQIHVHSRAPGPFVPINCARLPGDPAALHSELLGHVRGAFTGAESARVGKFFHAASGTLFLDEVESLSPLAQGFLLDVLEGTGDLSPLGSKELGIRAPIFRLVSASKVPLAQSGLRMDLCERLAEGHMWRMPTLQERREDIPGLFRFFVAEQSKMLGLPMDATDEAIACAMEAPWPGQIRQLRAMIVALSQIGLAAMPPQGQKRIVLRRADLEQHLREREEAFGAQATTRASTDVMPAVHTVLGVELAPPPGAALVAGLKTKADARALTREQLLRTLETTRFNQSEAARRLGIARNTLARRMREFGISGSAGV